MKKTIIYILFGVLLMFGTCELVNAKTVLYNVIPKKVKISPSIQGAVQKYKARNYVGAMQDLEKVIIKEPKNSGAYYYLALSYTQLGYREEAIKAYNAVKKLNNEPTLAFYSNWAIGCLSDNSGNTCKYPTFTTNVPNTDTNQVTSPNEMDVFITSGKKIHDSANDRILKERMERKLQQDEYNKKNQSNLSLNETPTNEEIAQALNTLSKLGINPLTQYQSPYISNNLNQNQLFSMLNQQNNYSNNLLYNYGNSDITKSFLNNQLQNQMLFQQLNTNGYGI